ncbi:TetR/AcrR family transcriptional regulator [Sphingobium sp. EM0848]|uniref:TetR/AcrR family transcriptional regulator n=1 Tax=Sphingobium sp. EM0848 TaxID=2743473 RepID=UPI00159C0426
MRIEPAAKRGYHHGELKEALIVAADSILREDGIEGFSLRAAARRAGVSPAAPAHHFGNAAGLLTEVAILAHNQLGEYLAAAPRGETPQARLRSLSRAYVEFALDEPGRFRLMFRKDLVNREDPRFFDSGVRAFTPFIETAAQAYGGDLATISLERDAGSVLAAWSTAHGIAHLALEDKFAFDKRGANSSIFLSELLPEILAAQWPDPVGAR